jgi:hypothetical protein
MIDAKCLAIARHFIFPFIGYPKRLYRIIFFKCMAYTVQYSPSHLVFTCINFGSPIYNYLNYHATYIISPCLYNCIRYLQLPRCEEIRFIEIISTLLYL